MALAVAARKLQRREEFGEIVGQSQERCTEILLFLDTCGVVDCGLFCVDE
jgi:hypothetical protein